MFQPTAGAALTAASALSATTGARIVTQHGRIRPRPGPRSHAGSPSSTQVIPVPDWTQVHGARCRIERGRHQVGVRDARYAVHGDVAATGVDARTRPSATEVPRATSPIMPRCP